uniref:Cinnamoyl-CoA hydratase-dehydrogenase n=1 Tax=Rhizophora mucronata TaxID=61149 RepID=A0A2P2MFW0_RHIMU
MVCVCLQHLKPIVEIPSAALEETQQCQLSQASSLLQTQWAWITASFQWPLTILKALGDVEFLQIQELLQVSTLASQVELLVQQYAHGIPSPIPSHLQVPILPQQQQQASCNLQ